MTPAQLGYLIDLHLEANGSDPDARTHNPGERVAVTAEQAPAVLTALASQRLTRK